MALDQASRAFMAQVAASGAPPTWQMTPVQARAAFAGFTPLYGPGPEMHTVSQHQLTTENGDTFKVRVLRPVEQPKALLVYYHGGGWALGDIDGFDTLGRRLAAATDATVILVDYRKAPECPHPAAVDDAWTALNWAYARMETIAHRCVPLVVAGDSAGGNLAAVTCLRARDESTPPIDLQILIYPVIAADFDTDTYLDPENQLMLTREHMMWFWNQYLPDPKLRTAADAAPLRAGSLGRLPPAVILLAEHDVLRDEGETYANRLRAAGVPVHLRVFEGQMHGFFSMVSILPGSDAGLDHVARHLRHVTRS